MDSKAKAERRSAGWLLILPLVLILVPFFIAPIIGVVAASFVQSDGFGGILAELHASTNYKERLHVGAYAISCTGRRSNSRCLTWFFSLLIGFWVAYFLVFHVRNPLLALGLFLLCTVPFWTSNIIRMISWIPLLGKEGLINSALIETGVIDQPLDVLLFSSFAVVSPMFTS